MNSEEKNEGAVSKLPEKKTLIVDCIGNDCSTIEITEAQRAAALGGNYPIRVGSSDTERLMLIKLFLPAFFSFCVVFISGYKIITTDPQTPNELRAVWWSTLTGTAASWLPSAASAIYGNASTTSTRKKDD